MKIGEGVTYQRLASFNELNLNVTVQTFLPGAASFRVWEDTTEPLNSKTYFRSHVALSCDYEMTMRFVDGTEEKVIIPPGKSWPHQVIPAGFRQVIGHPKKIEEGGQNFCIIPIDTTKFSLSIEQLDLESGQSKIIEINKLLIAYGNNYTVNGIVRGTIESPWSLTACVHQKAEIKAIECCRILIYQALPLTGDY